MSGKSLGFLELFPGCAGLAGMCGGLDKATVQGAVVKEDEYTMSVRATFARIPQPAALGALCVLYTSDAPDGDDV